MVLPASHGVPRAPWYSGRHPWRPLPFAYWTITIYGGTFQTSSARDTPAIRIPADIRRWPLQPPQHNACRLTCCGFGLLPFRSPLLGESILLSSPRGTKMFQFPRFPSLPYRFRQGCQGITPGGFPHSGIPGSTPACGYPRRIAACHALHRLPAPRHPPCALPSLTSHKPDETPKLCSFQGASPAPPRKPAAEAGAPHSALRFCHVISLSGLPARPLSKATAADRIACSGGDERNRTAGLLRAKQALSRLSYIPTLPTKTGGHRWARTTDLTLIRRAL